MSKSGRGVFDVEIGVLSQGFGIEKDDWVMSVSVLRTGCKAAYSEPRMGLLVASAVAYLYFLGMGCRARIGDPKCLPLGYRQQDIAIQ